MDTKRYKVKGLFSTTLSLSASSCVVFHTLYFFFVKQVDYVNTARNQVSFTLHKRCPYSELFWSAFFPHFPVFSPNAGKIRNRITPNTDPFYEVLWCSVNLYFKDMISKPYLLDKYLIGSKYLEMLLMEIEKMLHLLLVFYFLRGF